MRFSPLEIGSCERAGFVRSVGVVLEALRDALPLAAGTSLVFSG